MTPITKQQVEQIDFAIENIENNVSTYSCRRQRFTKKTLRKALAALEMDRRRKVEMEKWRQWLTVSNDYLFGVVKLSGPYFIKNITT